MQTTITHPNEPFGTLLGFAPGGVAIYSSDYSIINKQDYPDDSSFRSYLGHEYLGYKWQCVEFARRFLYLNYGVVFTDVRMAYEIFSLRYLRQVVNDAILPLQAFANGSKRAPVAGSLLIWQEGGEFKDTGHVAIITEVLAHKVRIVEQNVIHTRLPPGQQWTRELAITVSKGNYHIHDTFADTEILGWMTQTDNAQDSLPAPITAPKYMAIHTAQIEDKGQFKGKWLNESDPLAHAYVVSMKGHLINSGDIYRYFTISKSAEQELIRATNELHLMYLHATDKVLKEDKLLKHFNIPEILWPRLRLSWQKRRYQTITGRLDFCMDERGLKVYEYNADSASCHAEAGFILQQWANQAGLQHSANPSADLLDSLSECWKHSDAKKLVHIMQDKDSEEDYHALFMQQALTKAGFKTKILHGLDQLQWDKRGRLIDDEDQKVKCVWKTWAWETVLEQLRQESEEQAAPPVCTGHPENNVRLIDVLLRPEVIVFEPLWTVIPSNKAILPILWSLFPNHRYLLEATFELDEQLIQNGYAVKPIAGRCGNNIELVSHEEQILDKTTGKFAEQENIYQQLWCLPKVAEQYMQVSTFTVGGHYGGACLRSDHSLVIKGESDIQPLRVLNNKDFLKKTQKPT